MQRQLTPALVQTAAVVKGHRVLPAVSAACIVWLLVSCLPATASLPQTRTPVAVETASVLLGALPVTLALLLVLPEAAPALTQTSPRGSALWRVGRVLAPLAASAAVAYVVLPDGAHSSLVVAGLLGEALFLAAYAGDGLAWVAPLLHTVAAAVMGSGVEGRLATWAWVLDPGLDAGTWMLASLTLAAGLCAWARRPPAAN